MIKVKRDIGHLIKQEKDDGGFSNLSPEERVSFIWELTLELWFLTGGKYVERRLQRNVTNIVKTHC